MVGDLSWKVLALFVAASLSGSLSFADPCSQKDVFTIKMPVRELTSSATFDYHYRLLKADQPDSVTVIYIPGGPGDNSIGTRDPRPSSDYNLILTDPRGGGCNAASIFHYEDISTDKITGDLINLIRDLKLQNYVIHGLSYGTVAATVLANKIGHAGSSFTQPKAVILEGTVGRYADWSVDAWPTQLAWEAARSHFSTSLQQELDGAKFNPYNIFTDDWDTAVQNFLYFGDIYWTAQPWSHDKVFREMVRVAKGGTRDPDLDKIYQLKSFGQLPWSGIVFDSIMCEDIWSSFNFNISYSFGHFSMKPVNNCDQMPLPPHHYDSSQWQIPQPLIYFAGEYDRNVGVYQTDYHFAHQSGPRIQVDVLGGGHRSLQVNLRDCFPAVVQIASTPARLEDALLTCKAPISVRKAGGWH